MVRCNSVTAHCTSNVYMNMLIDMFSTISWVHQTSWMATFILKYFSFLLLFLSENSIHQRKWSLFLIASTRNFKMEYNKRKNLFKRSALHYAIYIAFKLYFILIWFKFDAKPFWSQSILLCSLTMALHSNVFCAFHSIQFINPLNNSMALLAFKIWLIFD